MARILCALFLFFSVFTPVPANAAGFSVNIAVSRQDDGTTTGEIWYNDRVVWRLRLASDGVRPVSGQTGADMTVVVPDIENGLFLLKVYNK